MARFAFRSGNGSEIINPVSSDRAEPKAARRTTRLHLNWAADDSAWRVLACLAAGEEDVLVCMGTKRQEAVDGAKARVSAGDLPEGTLRLILECWKGGRLSGRWVEVQPARGELPRLPRRRRRSWLVERA